MATQRSKVNTQRGQSYRTNGAAAYDVRYTDYQRGTEAPVRQPARKQAPKTQPKKQAREQLTVAPMAVLGMLLAGVMLLLVVCGYVQLYEVTNEVGALEDQVVLLQEQNSRLQSSYDEKIDLTAVEAAATELGMHAPNSKQTVYLNLTGRDKAEILETEDIGFFEYIFEAFRSTGQRLIEYLG